MLHTTRPLRSCLWERRVTTVNTPYIHTCAYRFVPKFAPPPTSYCNVTDYYHCAWIRKPRSCHRMQCKQFALQNNVVILLFLPAGVGGGSSAYFPYVKFEVLSGGNYENLTPCKLVDRYLRFGATWSLHLLTLKLEVACLPTAARHILQDSSLPIYLILEELIRFWYYHVRWNM
jgi:hypothetical protein